MASETYKFTDFETAEAAWRNALAKGLRATMSPDNLVTVEFVDHQVYDLGSWCSSWHGDYR